MTSVLGDSKFFGNLTQISTTFMLKTSSNYKVLEVKSRFKVEKFDQERLQIPPEITMKSYFEKIHLNLIVLSIYT